MLPRVRGARSRAIVEQPPRRLRVVVRVFLVLVLRVHLGALRLLVEDRLGLLGLGLRGRLRAPLGRRRLDDGRLALVGPALRAERLRLAEVIELRAALEARVLGTQFLAGHCLLRSSTVAARLSQGSGARQRESEGLDAARRLPCATPGPPPIACLPGRAARSIRACTFPAPAADAPTRSRTNWSWGAP